MLRDLTDKVRLLVHDVLSSERADHLRPVKAARDLLGTANDLVGRPFCSAAELERRRARRSGWSGGEHEREAAPVMLYFDGKDHRTKKKMEDVLRARDIPFQVLDVTDDEASRSWARTAARNDEFPLLFIAGEPVGGLHELTEMDVNGELKKRVFGG